MAAIEDAIKKLGDKHLEHIAVYGEDNDLRLTGEFSFVSSAQGTRRFDRNLQGQ
jgi:glutamine synthetase